MINSALFVVLSYALMGAMGVIGAPLLIREAWTRAWMKLYIRLAFGLARALVGLRVEVRGTVPMGRVLIAAKHQSLLDVLALYRALPEARFVMKRELLWTPVFGLFARRTGAVPIDRRPGSGAVRQLVTAFGEVGGQAVIYPQGTRVAPGVEAPYKRGAVALYEALGLPVVLVATNAGHYWPRRGVRRYPGTAVIEFLPEPIPPGGDPAAVGETLRTRIEAASARLSQEAATEGRPPP